MVSGDTIVFNPSTLTITQNHSGIAISLNYVSSTQLTATQSVNTTTQVYLQRNINIKAQMTLEINNETKLLAKIIANCNDATLTDNNYIGEPTEVALLTYANTFDIKIDNRIETQSKIIEDLKKVKEAISNSIASKRSLSASQW